MKMTKLATLFLTATLSLASGAALAADSGAQTNNGQANAAADAGQVAPDARENVAPKMKSTRTPCAKMVAVRISIKRYKPVMASIMMSIPKPTVPRSNPAK